MSAIVTGALAEIAVAAGDAERAADLLGLAAAVRGTPDRGSPTIRATEQAAREALGDNAFDAIYAGS